jgi:hypothetical protein
VKVLRLVLTILAIGTPLLARWESNVSLTISFADGTSRFHVGEVIPIQLSFSASTPNTYEIEMRNYDRSGRLNIETYHVTPSGRDPLQNYYSIGGFMMGGLGGPRELTSEPRVMPADLNEWVALDRPGHYSLFVTSGRVSRNDGIKNEPVELQSNSLEFDIVPANPTWQQQTLSTALATLNMGSSTPDERRAASRTLRFLDTPASVHEIVRLLGTRPDGNNWDEVAGLAGSQYQGLAVRELEQQMSVPDVALTGGYLYLLAKLKFQLDHEPLPPYPEKDTEQQKIWNERRQAQDKDFASLQDSLFDKAATLVPNKTGTARAETVHALLVRPSREPTDDVKPLGGLPADEVASAFLNLTPDEQWGLLATFWERLKVPAMVEPLKKVAGQPNMQHQMLRDLALRCLFELDPVEASPIFLEEIRHPHLDNGMFTVKGETLALLPNETLPQFDQMLSARLEQKESRTRGFDAQLVGRFSTKAIQTKVKSIYEASPGSWDCVTEDGFVLYFLRVDPDYGVKRAGVTPSACMANSLPAVIRMKRWSEVEPGIITPLNGSDLNRARQAAETLAKYGSPQAEKVLWERLRVFHAQWAGRGDELVYRAEMAKDANEAIGFQFGLVEAIGRAQAWLLTNEEITELESLTLGQERDNVKQWHWSSPVDLDVTFFGDKILASVHQYVETDLNSLRSKLAQYPRGTKFLLNISNSPSRVDPVLTVVNEVAAEHGFQLEVPPQTVQ